jgi:hypothetical protein
MANIRCRWECPEQWSEWSQWLSAGLHARNRWRLPVLLVGILFAGGRRTVTTWLRAAGVSGDFDYYYYFLAALGRKTKSIATQLVTCIVENLPLPERVLLVIDDSPTIWTNLAVYNLNLWMHTLVELWAWDKSHEELCNRGDSPWDDATRRPSHANRRKALRQQIMHKHLSSITSAWSLPTTIIQLAESLVALAA